MQHFWKGHITKTKIFDYIFLYSLNSHSLSLTFRYNWIIKNINSDYIFDLSNTLYLFKHRITEIFWIHLILWLNIDTWRYLFMYFEDCWDVELYLLLPGWSHWVIWCLQGGNYWRCLSGRVWWVLNALDRGNILIAHDLGSRGRGCESRYIRL